LLAVIAAINAGIAMNTKLAAGSGVGLVVGMLIGLLVDVASDGSGMAMVLGGAIGIPLGAGVAVAMVGKSEDEK
jgi:hypothetical protein